MARPAPALVTTGPDPLPYDLRRLAGRLAFDGVPFTVEPTACGAVPPDFECRADGTYVLIGSKHDRELHQLGAWRDSLRSARAVVMAGREVTYQQERLSPPRRNETIISGDPEETVVSLAGSRPGRAIVRGTPWDPARFVAASIPACGSRTALVLYSAGCERRCGYCPYGPAFEALYGAARRAVRSVENVAADIRRCAAAGFTAVRLEADQAFASGNGAANAAFADLAREVRSMGPDAPALQLTLSTRDVVDNATVLREAARLVRCHVFLNVDFATDAMLAKFELPSTTATHLEALRVLHESAIAFTIHFIFFHPWLDAGGIHATLRLLRDAQPLFARNAVPFAAALVHQVLLTSLQTDRCIPSNAVLREEAKSVRPDPVAMRFAGGLPAMLESERELVLRAAASRDSAVELELLDRCEELLAGAMTVRD